MYGQSYCLWTYYHKLSNSRLLKNTRNLKLTNDTYRSSQPFSTQTNFQQEIKFLKSMSKIVHLYM